MTPQPCVACHGQLKKAGVIRSSYRPYVLSVMRRRLEAVAGPTIRNECL